MTNLPKNSQLLDEIYIHFFLMLNVNNIVVERVWDRFMVYLFSFNRKVIFQTPAFLLKWKYGVYIYKSFISAKVLIKN